MAKLMELLDSDTNFTISIQKNDLFDFGRFLITETEKRLIAEVTASQAESYLTRLETCEFLKVDQSTLHRWKQRNYLMPVEVGGRRLYKMSDLKRILNGGGK